MPRTETPEQRRRRRAKAVCVYCGVPLAPNRADKWPGTCNLHDDLPQHDPNYMASLRRGPR